MALLSRLIRPSTIQVPSVFSCRPSPADSRSVRTNSLSRWCRLSYTYTYIWIYMEGGIEDQEGVWPQP